MLREGPVSPTYLGEESDRAVGDSSGRADAPERQRRRKSIADFSSSAVSSAPQVLGPPRPRESSGSGGSKRMETVVGNLGTWRLRRSGWIVGRQPNPRHHQRESRVVLGARPIKLTHQVLSIILAVRYHTHVERLAGTHPGSCAHRR